MPDNTIPQNFSLGIIAEAVKITVQEIAVDISICDAQLFLTGGIGLIGKFCGVDLSLLPLSLPALGKHDS